MNSGKSMRTLLVLALGLVVCYGAYSFLGAVPPVHAKHIDMPQAQALVARNSG